MRPFFEPDVQTSLLTVTTNENGTCKSYSPTVTSACALACVPVESCQLLCVSSPWGLGCPVHGSRKQLTATNRHYTGPGLKCPHPPLGQPPVGVKGELVFGTNGWDEG